MTVESHQIKGFLKDFIVIHKFFPLKQPLMRKNRLFN